jgi:tryptophan-rich sensory protein
MKRSAIIIFGITFVVALLSMLCVLWGTQWYHTLRLPSYTPASWFISTMWFIIYCTTATAAYLVWEHFERNKQFWAIIALFCTNALLNLAWTHLFFYHHAPFLALVDAVLLFVTVLALVIMTGKRSLMVAALLTPYLAWILYALLLNASVWILNI